MNQMVDLPMPFNRDPVMDNIIKFQLDVIVLMDKFSTLKNSNKKKKEIITLQGQIDETVDLFCTRSHWYSMAALPQILLQIYNPYPEFWKHNI